VGAVQELLEENNWTPPTEPITCAAGSPVAFVRTKDVGVSSAGDVREGELDRTTEPVPVVVAAEIAVPFP
jgi:hypothetical protein